MKRREFMILFGAAAAYPFAARAQVPMPVIGFIGVTSLEEWKRYVDAFHRGLQEAGFVAGRNVALEYRWAEGRYDQLPAMAADLVGRKVNVIVAVAPPAAQAVKAATGIIPTVFFMGSDRSSSASSPASIVPAATSRASACSPTRSVRSVCSCCARSCRPGQPSLCWSIRPIPMLNPTLRRCGPRPEP